MAERRGVEESGTGPRNEEVGGTQPCSDTPLLLLPTSTPDCHFCLQSHPTDILEAAEVPFFPLQQASEAGPLNAL